VRLLVIGGGITGLAAAWEAVRSSNGPAEVLLVEASGRFGGKVLTELREGQRTIDLLLRLPAEWRDSPEKIGNLPIQTGTSADGHVHTIPLRFVADVREAKGPNVINRENTQRRIVIGMNTSERD